MTTAPSAGILDSLTAEQLAALRRSNDAKYRGWDQQRVIRLHRRTVADEADGGAEYIAGVRRHLSSGLYRRIYPPHVVEATRAWLAGIR